MHASQESKQLISESKTRPQSTKWTIPIALAQENEAYWQVVNFAIKCQVGHFILQKRRGTTKNGAPYFLQESVSFSKAREHANHIQNGLWIHLDLNHSEFVRDIFMAMRLRKISIAQMSTALLLHSAKEQFKDHHGFQIKQFHFEEKGPYSASSITYATEKQLKNFKNKLAKLPKNEQFYFSFNLPRKHTITFLLDGLNTYARENYLQRFYSNYKKFLVFLKKYVQQLKLSDSQKQEYMIHIKNLGSPSKHQNAVTKLTHLIKEQENDLKSFFQPKEKNKDRSSLLFLIALLRVNEEIPALEISPDYDPTNPESPILSFILPTLSALKTLQLAVHGKNHRVDPYYLLGPISTRMIRYLDETPYQFGLKNPARPIELTHPDFKKNEFPHNSYSHDFLLTWHDLLHAWRSSNILYKPFIRHLRRRLTDEKGFDMSKAIWYLSDMDISHSREIRQEMKYNNARGVEIERINLIRIILDDIGVNFFKDINSHDINLFLIADMIIHFSAWKSFYLDICSAGKLPFLEAYEAMEKIIDDDWKSTGTVKPAAFYILAYRLNNEEKSLDLCEKLWESGLNKIIYWERNGDLCFKDQKYFGCKYLRELNSKTLYEKLSGLFVTKEPTSSFSLWNFFCCCRKRKNQQQSHSESQKQSPVMVLPSRDR